MTEKTKDNGEEIYVKVSADGSGKISVDTNMNGLGAIHFLSQSQQIIIEQFIQDNKEKEKDKEESKIEIAKN